MENQAALSAEVFLRLLGQVFGYGPRPDYRDVFRTAALLPKYDREFLISGTIDLATALPSDVSWIYETNTFYTAEGYRWRIPQMFAFALKWREKVISTDYVNTFFTLLYIDGGDRLVEKCTKRQRLCIWLGLECLDHELSEVIDFMDDVEENEILSSNLFGSTLPPFVELSEMRTKAQSIK